MTGWKARWLVGLCSLSGLLGGAAPVAHAQVQVQIGVQIGSYPRLVRVPGYPVYYSPGAPANLFFYDGLYWLYAEDGWYTSSWYNGPWAFVDPFAVPVYLLRVPVRYYPAPPVYFRAWRPDAAPRWDDHWGPRWADRHRGWDHWDHRKAPPPAPLPVYQRPYAGERYPSADEQRRLQQSQYRYQPREPVAREHLAPPPGRAPEIPHHREHLDRPVPPPPWDNTPPPRRVPEPPQPWEGRSHRGGPDGREERGRDSDAGPRGPHEGRGHGRDR